MKIRESEIFLNYCRLAIDAGLVSEQIEKTAQEDEPKKEEFTDVEALYGIKPKKTIIEIAHPETVVIGPAYDAMNAVVENEHQRQDIISYIALKHPSSNYSQRRYVVAANDLQKTLISTAFAMDNAEQMEVMSLADSCAQRMQKIAFPWLISGLTMAALTAINWYFTRAEVDVQNINANSQVLLDELDDVSEEPYARSVIELIQKIRTQSTGYLDKMASLSQMGRSITEAARSGNIELIESINAKAQPMISDLEKIIQGISVLAQDLNSIKSEVHMFSSQKSDRPDWYQKLVSLKDDVFGSDTNDVVLAIDGLIKACMQTATRSSSVIEGFKQKYGAAIGKKIQIEKDKVANKPAEPNAPELNDFLWNA